jgi:hypothetical protein
MDYSHSFIERQAVAYWARRCRHAIWACFEANEDGCPDKAAYYEQLARDFAVYAATCVRVGKLLQD